MGAHVRQGRGRHGSTRLRLVFRRYNRKGRRHLDLLGHHTGQEICDIWVLDEVARTKSAVFCNVARRNDQDAVILACNKIALLDFRSFLHSGGELCKKLFRLSYQPDTHDKRQRSTDLHRVHDCYIGHDDSAFAKTLQSLLASSGGQAYLFG